MLINLYTYHAKCKICGAAFNEFGTYLGLIERGEPIGHPGGFVPESILTTIEEPECNHQRVNPIGW